MRYMPNGGAVANLRLATSESWRDKATGEQKEVTEWHTVVIFGKLAEVAGEYLRKGSQVYIEGQLRTRKWQDKDQQDRYSTEVVVSMNGVMQMLGGRRGVAALPLVRVDSNSLAEAVRQLLHHGTGTQGQQPQQGAMPDFEDDIPFAPVTLPFPNHAIHAL